MANNDYITTDCKLTVSKNTAKLDEEIFLYKNDRNIKLLIEIVDNKYRYKSDDLSNLLVKYKASYAQVKWYKNAEVKKEFPIQATDDGKVVFVIEGQLIDEDTELGDYDLQLRLLNESQESIRSLPIIKGAVHILKPLFEEGDIATVNSAVADVSMLSLDGDAIDTYNSDGTYNQTNWGNGDVISSAKLNKLEKVAKDNVDKVNKMPAKSIVEGGKIYLAKEDGTKLDSGTELPAGGSTIEVVNNLESDSTTAALSAAQGKALNTQYKDIVNKIDNIGTGSLNLRDVQNGEIFVLKTFMANIPVTAVALNKSTLKLNVGDSETLIPTITPDNATSSTIIWSCSNDNAKVEGGTVTALKAGSCVITATSNDTTNGTIKATCNVTCTNVSVQSVSISGDTEVSTSTSIILTANITPSNATNKNITWTKDNDNVNLTPRGLKCEVLGVTEGNSIITATTEDKNKIATYNITISAGIVTPSDCDIDSTNLQGYYRMNHLNSDNTKILDISGNGRDMTIYPNNMTMGDGYYTRNNTVSSILNDPQYSPHDSGSDQFKNVFNDNNVTLFLTVMIDSDVGKESLFTLEENGGFSSCTYEQGVIIFNAYQSTFNEVQSETKSCIGSLCTLTFKHDNTNKKDYIYKDGTLLNEQDSKVIMVKGKVAEYLGVSDGYSTDSGKIKYYNWAVYNTLLDTSKIQEISTKLLNNAGGGN